ncbi:MAG TPA: uroporphyrinogen-III synthase [Bryobacteraceae bacterium]|nr:uroporphyrinogen-III synthase [Bryobacteraceae bacterium]
MSFAGMRVLSLESRRSAEIAELIRKQGGDPVLAPSMREAPLEKNDEAFRFAERLFAGEFDMMILLTGVGTRLLDQTLSARYPAGQFAEALRRITVVARGPKPAAVLRAMDVPVTVTVPEPNTWRELLAAIADRPERRIAVQEYGRSNSDLLEALRQRSDETVSVRVYQWDLPADTRPLRQAAQLLAAGAIDVALFTTAMQIVHLLRVAAEERIEDAARAALRRIVVGSIGPTTSEALDDAGVKADLEPSHPRMGLLVQETAAGAEAIARAKK